MEGNLERDPSSSPTSVMGSSDEGVEGETEQSLRCQGHGVGGEEPILGAGGGISQEQKPQVLSTFLVVCGLSHRFKGEKIKNFKMVRLKH